MARSPARFAIVAALGLRWYARKQLFDSGRLIRIWPYVIGLLIGLPLLASLLFACLCAMFAGQAVIERAQ